jgi:hypothetical protein
MTTVKQLAPPPPTSQVLDTRQWRDWLYSIYTTLNNNTGGLGTMAYQDANNVNITGGTINGTNLNSQITTINAEIANLQSNAVLTWMSF